MTPSSPTQWKTIAIVLALMLAVALICLALILNDVMKLGLSLV
jgi:hypothetical protein